MAQHFTVVAANRSVDVKSPTLVEDVMEIHAVTRPHGVSFTRVVNYDTWRSKGAKAALETIAAHIEHIMASRPNVREGNAVQNVTSGGLIVNAVEFVIRLDPPDGAQPGPFTDHVVIPVQVLHDQDSFDGYFQPVLDALHTTAGY